MTTATSVSQVCLICGEDKPLTEFHKDNSRRRGVVPYCKSCRAPIEKDRFARLMGTIPDMTKEEFFLNLNLRGQQVDDRPDDFCWFYTGKTYHPNATGHRTAFARTIELMSPGRNLPSKYEMWCDNKGTCINPTHLTDENDLNIIDGRELFEDDEGIETLEATGFSIHQMPKSSKKASIYQTLIEAQNEFDHFDAEQIYENSTKAQQAAIRAGDALLTKNGYNLLNGEPIKNRRVATK